jgi:flagellar basal-body rod protein FlgB
MTGILAKDFAFQAISFALDGLSVRQRAIASNIANVDTPGYKAKQVNFEDQFQRVLDSQLDSRVTLKTTNLNHIAYNSISFGVKSIHKETSLRNDENNVDADLEMTKLAETTIRYQTLAQLAGMKLSILKSIVRESR